MLSPAILKLSSRWGGVFILTQMATLVRTSHAALFVMRPHADDLDDLFVFQNMVHQPMLDVDPAGTSSSEIAHKLLKRWRRLKWVFSHELRQFLCFLLQSSISGLTRIFPSLLGENDSPAHQSSRSEHALMGIFNPSRMDSRIPGIDSKKTVS